MNNPTDNDSSEQTGLEARSETPTSVDVAMQRRFNELRRELLDNRAAYIDRWLSVIVIVLTFFAIVAVVAGYIGFGEFKKLNDEVKEIENRAIKSVENAERHAEETKGYAEETERLVEETKHLVDEIKSHRDEAKKMVKAIREMNAQVAADAPEKAKQVVANIRENPEASPIDKAIARAVSLQQQGKKVEAAEKWRTVANVAEESDNSLAAIAWFSVGYLLQDPKDRISAYNEAIRLEPGLAAAYTNRGNARLALGQHEAAIADHDMAIRLNLDYAAAYSNRGLAKHKLGQYKAAIADYDEAIHLEPDFVEAYYNRGVDKKILGLKDEARKDFKTALELARNANNAKIVAQAEQKLRDLATEGGS